MYISICIITDWSLQGVKVLLGDIKVLPCPTIPDIKWNRFVIFIHMFLAATVFHSYRSMDWALATCCNDTLRVVCSSLESQDIKQWTSNISTSACESEVLILSICDWFWEEEGPFAYFSLADRSRVTHWLGQWEAATLWLGGEVPQPAWTSSPPPSLSLSLSTSLHLALSDEPASLGFTSLKRGPSRTHFAIQPFSFV